MFHIYLFHFDIIIFAFFPEESNGGGVPEIGVLKNFAKFTRKHLYRTGVSFLSAASSFINEETPAQCFPKPLTIFAKSSIVYVRLGYKCASVLPPDLKPSHKDFIL